MTAIESEYNRLRTEWAFLPDIGVGLVELTGKDAMEWLQGQATNDIRGASASQSISFCLCEPTGQLLALCDLALDRGRILIATDNVQAVIHRAETMVILEDVVARDLSNEFDLVSVQGPAASPQVRDLVLEGSFVVPNNRLGLPGWDVWSPKPGGKPNLISAETYEVLRVESGIPKRGVDYTSKTLPPELGPAFDKKHISYNKGCYTGQEVLMRIHSRGHTNKTWVGLLLDEPVQVGAKVSHESREDAGVVTSAAVSPRFGPIAAAMVRNEAAEDGSAINIGGISGEVRTLPFVS